MKCIGVRFPSSKQQSFFWKVSLNAWLMGLIQLYTGHTGGSSREKAFNKVLSTSWQCVSRGIVVMKQPGVYKVQSLIPGRTCFPLLFFFFFPFPLRLVISLVIVILFCLFIYLKFFKFINFLSCCLISPSTPCRSPVLSHSIGLEYHFNTFQIHFPPIFSHLFYPLVYVFPYKVTGHSFVMIVPVR